MKYKEKLKYISNRALVLGTVVFGSFIILAVIQLLLAYKGETPWWIAIIITIFAILFPTVFWLWIHRPYMRCEKMMDRFLEGYIFSEKEDMELLNLTPSIQKQMKMVDRIVRSPQYMDLNKRQAQYLALQNQIQSPLPLQYTGKHPWRSHYCRSGQHCRYDRSPSKIFPLHHYQGGESGFCGGRTG